MKNSKFSTITFVSCFLFLVSSTTAQAQSVDLLWQGEGYVPPFYEGKSLWSKQSAITFLAIPQGLGDPANLNYRWIRNGTVLGNVSGVGRNTLSFTDALFSKPYRVVVQIVDNNDETLAESSVSVGAIDPVLMVYERSPLYGYLFQQAIEGRYVLDKEEVTFSAFPLFASPANRNAATFSFRWGSNNEAVQTGHTITFRSPEGASGTSEVELTFSNTEKVVRAITKSFLVEFGNENE